MPPSKNPLADEDEAGTEDVDYDKANAEKNMQKILDAAEFLKKTKDEPEAEKGLFSNIPMMVAFGIWALSLVYLFAS